MFKELSFAQIKKNILEAESSTLKIFCFDSYAQSGICNNSENF